MLCVVFDLPITTSQELPSYIPTYQPSAMVSKHGLLYRMMLAGLAWVLAFGQLASADDFRPSFHFVPRQNWMNEPNGLIKIGSTWHLFFQHNPN